MKLAQDASMTRPNSFSETGETPRTVRKAVRVPVKAEVRMRRSGQSPYRLVVVDMTASGCRVQFVDRPKLHEQVWLKFDHLEPLPATVCWINGFEAGLELDRPMRRPTTTYAPLRYPHTLPKKLSCARGALYAHKTLRYHPQRMCIAACTGTCFWNLNQIVHI